MKVCGDSRLVVSQVNGEFEAKDETMAKYPKLVKAIMTQFYECYMEHIPREENMKADALSKFAYSELCRKCILPSLEDPKHQWKNNRTY